MAEVAEAALANRTEQVILWGCCCHSESVVLASEYLQAAAIKTVHNAQASDACVSVEHTASWYVLSLTTGGMSICWRPSRMCDGHAVTNVCVVSAVTLHSRPQILERVDVLERSVADVHLAQQSISIRLTPLCRLHNSIGQRALT